MLTAAQFARMLDMVRRTLAESGCVSSDAVEALGSLVKLFAARGELPAVTAAIGLQSVAGTPRPRARRTAQPTIDPSAAANMPVGQVLDIIDGTAVRKADLVLLGHSRFGMSRSVLTRMSIPRLKEAVRQAATNARTIDIIGRVASRPS